METPWTESVDYNNPLPEYPRPQMARGFWLNLNGIWDYAISKSTRFPKDYDGSIVVPFSPECELSGVERTVKKDEFLWYHRKQVIPDSFLGKRILLHFNAVDRDAVVWVNDIQVCSHSGGYLPFETDISKAVTDNVVNITVRVYDDTDRGSGSRGKQRELLLNRRW